MIKVEIDQGTKSLEEAIVAFGRIGGPTEYGWHTHEPSFRCPREHHLTNLEANQKTGSNGKQFALGVGTVFHEFLASYYAEFISEKPPTDGGDTSPEALYAYLCANGFSDVANEAKRLYDGYKRRYDGHDSYLSEDVRIIAVEHHVRRDFPWGQPYTARADVVIHQPDGYWIVDHKTAAARTVEFVEGWQIQPGIIGLVWACVPEFSPIRGVSINGVIKTKTPDYDRFQYVVDDRTIEDWLAMMRYKWSELKEAEKAGWPPNFAACFRKMGPRVGKCRFWNRCVYGVVEE